MTSGSAIVTWSRIIIEAKLRSGSLVAGTPASARNSRMRARRSSVSM